MKMDRKKPDLQQEALTKNPFGVPEGYFEGFADRLQQRIKEEESSRVPVRKIGTTTRWLAMAAAVLAAALITTTIVRLTSSNGDTNGFYPDQALLEQMQLLEDDRYLYELLEEEENADLDEEDAFASQAIEYLATNDVEMDLIFE
jgi:hypothetical protein